MKRTVFVVALALASSIVLAAQDRNASPAAESKPAGAVPVPPVEIRTWVSQTAAYLGDHVTYVVELRCAPQVDILTDDLVPEQLTLDGLEVLETASERDESVADRVVHRMRYTLASYAVDADALTIAAIPVRYSVRRPGQRAEEALPAGEVVVPPLTLGLRSTIPPSDTAVAIRDQRTAQPLPRRVRYANAIGLVLVALAIAPVALWGADLARRVHRARPRRRRRVTPQERRAALDELRGLDVSSEAARRDAYARLDAWLREHVQLSSGIPAAALTPPEIQRAAPDARRVPWLEQIERVLVECERAKYAADPPPADRWPALVDEAAELTRARGR